MTNPKSTDPRHLSWKGASIFARLAASQESWLLRVDYEEMGMRLVREKALFHW